MKPTLSAFLTITLFCAVPDAWADSRAWDLVWKSETAVQDTSVVGMARTVARGGKGEREASPRVRAAGGKVRLDYVVGPARWSLIDDGDRLIRLDDKREHALVLPRPAFVLDRALAQRNYGARVVGQAPVAGRPTQIVEIAPQAARGDRPEPALWRLWLDRQTSFALKRERYNADGKLATSTEYLEVTFGTPVSAEIFAIPPGWKVLDFDGSGACLEIPALERRVGFAVLLPQHLPSGYVLIGGYLQKRGRMQFEMAELRYTDGLRVLSVLQREREARAVGSDGDRHGFGRRHGRGRGRSRAPGRRPRRGFGPPGPEEMTLIDRGSEKALRYMGKERVVVVVGDLSAEELMRIARSLE